MKDGIIVTKAIVTSILIWSTLEFALTGNWEKPETVRKLLEFYSERKYIQQEIVKLDYLNQVLTACDEIARRRAWRKYTSYWLEKVADSLKFSEPRKRWHRLLGRDYFSKWPETVAEAFWWLQIVMLREDGKLPAWEGIRIVREQVNLQKAERR